MKCSFVDCFLIVSGVFSIRSEAKLSEVTNSYYIQDDFVTQVNVSLCLLQFTVISIVNTKTEFSFLLYQRWQDSRLRDDKKTRKLAISGQIWKPLVTVTDGTLNHSPENDKTQFWRGFGAEGTVLFSEKLTADIQCTQNYKYFPFDTQICTIKLGTYRFPMNEVKLVWDRKPVEVQTPLDCQEFKLITVGTFYEINKRPTGNFTVLLAQFVLRRHSLSCILNIIVPTAVIVFLSYLTTWLSSDLTSVRILLCSLSVLGLVYIYHTSKSVLPKSSVITGIDVWLIVCTIICLYVLIHSLIIDTLHRNALRKVSLSEYDKNAIWTQSLFAVWLDRALRIVHPIACTLLTALYYIIYQQ